MNALTPYLTLIKVGAIILLLVTCVGIGAYEMHKHDTVKYDKLLLVHTTFVAQTKAAGDAQNKQTDATIKANQILKEQSDADYKKQHTADINTILRLRHDADSRGSFVPPSTATSNRPDLACFDRASLERALGAFIGDIRGLSDEGTKATIDLNLAKKWAASVK